MRMLLVYVAAPHSQLLDPVGRLRVPCSSLFLSADVFPIPTYVYPFLQLDFFLRKTENANTPKNNARIRLEKTLQTHTQRTHKYCT